MLIVPCEWVKIAVNTTLATLLVNINNIITFMN